jgi:serine/threonine protein phosphatase PrpC
MSKANDKRQEIIQKRLIKELPTQVPTISLLTKQTYLLKKRQTKNNQQATQFKLTSSLASPKKYSSTSKHEISELLRSHDAAYNTKSMTGIARLPNLDMNVPKDTNRLLTHSPTQLTRSPALIKQRLRISSARELVEKRETLPIKVVSSCTFKTRIGMIRNINKKHNQDSYLIQHNFGGVKEQHLFGVFDGHGVNGHHVSEYIKQNLPKNLESRLSNEEDFNDLKLTTILKLAFNRTNRELNYQNDFDISYSGSTCVSILIRNGIIISANLGDSRAVLARQLPRGPIAIDLTTDHKPDLDHERERIESAGGRVDTYKTPNGQPYGPPRVWFRDSNIPGLAMSRSFGDSIAARVGVISEPDIGFHRIHASDKFIIIASDGLWEFISSQEAVEIVASNIGATNEQICDILIEEAATRWKKNEDMVDDITVLLVFFTKS